MATKIDPKSFWIVAVPFVTADDRAYKKGQRYRGDDPYVQLYAAKGMNFFLPEEEASADAIMEAASREFTRTYDRAIERHEAAKPKVEAPRYERAAPSLIPVKDQVTCILGTDIGGENTGDEPHLLREGELAHKDWKIVREHRDNFRPANPKGLHPGSALVAKAKLTMHDRGGEVTRVVYAGQWVEASDDLVAIHPHMFTGAPWEYAGEKA